MNVARWSLGGTDDPMPVVDGSGGTGRTAERAQILDPTVRSPDEGVSVGTVGRHGAGAGNPAALVNGQASTGIAAECSKLGQPLLLPPGGGHTGAGCADHLALAAQAGRAGDRCRRQRGYPEAEVTAGLSGKTRSIGGPGGRRQCSQRETEDERCSSLQQSQHRICPINDLRPASYDTARSHKAVLH